MPVISFKGLIFVIVLVTVAVIVNGAPAPGNTLPNKSSSAAVLAANLIRVHQVYQQQQPSSSVKPTQILVEAPSSSSPLRFTFKSQLETMDLPAVCPADATVIGITGNAEESIRISDISAASYTMEFARGGSLVRFATSGRRLSVKSPEMGWSPMHLTCEKMQEVGMLAIEMNPDDLVAAAGIVEYYMPSTKCSGNSASGAFHVADYPEPVITHVDTPALSRLLRSIIHSSASMMLEMPVVKGHMTFSATGEVNLVSSSSRSNTSVCNKNVHFEDFVHFGGMNGLAHGGVELVGTPVVTKGVRNVGIELKTPVRITNPSSLHLKLSQGPSSAITPIDGFVFKVKYGGEIVGTATIPSVDFLPSSVSTTELIVLYHPLTPRAVQVGSEMLGLFAQAGSKIPISLVGGSDFSTDVDVLKESFDGLEFDAQFDGLKQTFIDSVKFSIPNIFTGKAKATVSLNNPFSTPLKIKMVKATMTAANTTIGILDREFGDTFKIPSNTLAKSPIIEIIPRIKPALFAEFVSKGSVAVNVDAIIVMDVDDYEVTIHYVQDAIEARLGSL